MKRFFLMSTLLLATMLVCAQTKIAPNMKKGMKKVYVTEAKISAPSKPVTTITAETVYEVVDATADGYVLDVYVTDVKSDAKDAESRIYSLATEMMKDVHTQYATDKDGKVTKILNAEEGKKRINEMLDNVLAVGEWGIDRSIVLCPHNVEHAEKSLCLPWYMVMFLHPGI